MTCNRCGAWHADAGSRYCSQCGATMPTVPTVPTVHAVPPYPVDEPTIGDTSLRYPEPPPPPSTPPAGPAAAQRDWLRHPGTWAMGATALLVAGIVLAAVILSGGSGDSGKSTPAAAERSPSTTAAAVATTSPTTPAPSPSTSTQTVIVVPAVPGQPAETRTVTVAPEPAQPVGSASDQFIGATDADSSYYQRGSTVYFDSPSHNIGCRLVANGTQAQCTIADYNFSEPGHDCSIGAGVLMDSGSRPVIDCIHNSPYGGESVLGYGQELTFGSFTCVSQTTGITCTDTYNSGFTLSKARYLEY